jgi:hypothetical protein
LGRCPEDDARHPGRRPLDPNAPYRDSEFVRLKLSRTQAVPLVSVVLIFLNEERFLEEAVGNVRDQTLADWVEHAQSLRLRR